MADVAEHRYDLGPNVDTSDDNVATLAEKPTKVVGKHWFNYDWFPPYEAKPAKKVVAQPTEKIAEPVFAETHRPVALPVVVPAYYYSPYFYGSFNYFVNRGTYVFNSQ